MLRDVALDLPRGWLAMALVLMVTLVGLFGAGCGASQTNQKAVIRFSTWGSAEEIAVIRSLIEEFEAKHPDTQVDLIHIPENYFQKLHILIAGDLTPDVMFVNSLSFPMYAENDIFAPLDSYLSVKDATTLSRSTFFEAAVKALSWEGHVYAVPRDVSNLVVFYNRDLFDQAGLNPPNANWTLEDMRTLGQKLTRDLDGDGSRDQFGVSFLAKPPLFWLPFVWSQGGDVFNPEMSRFVMGQPVAVNALQFYADLRNRWHAAPTRMEVGSASMSQLFLQGKLAIMVSGRWTVPVLRQQAKFNWDVAPFPTGKNGSRVGIDASGYAISRKTANPDACWALVSFLSSRQAQEAFAQSGLIVPARKDVAQAPAFLSAPPAHGRVFIDIIESGVPTHVPERWNEIAEELNLALEPVWEGTQTAKDAMDGVAPKIEKLLQ